MFNNKRRVARKMKEGGSPLRVPGRDAVTAMWKEHQAYLSEQSGYPVSGGGR